MADFTSDSARKLAEENGLTVDQITGTGKDGNVTVKDVKAAVAASNTPAKSEQSAEAAPEKKKPSAAVVGVKQAIAATSLDQQKALEIAARYGDVMRQLEAEEAKLQFLTTDNPDDVATAKRVRIDISSLCSQLARQKKTDKAAAKAETDFIDSVFNAVNDYGRGVQERAKEIETYQERIKQKEAENKRLQRTQELQPYMAAGETVPQNIGELDDGIYDSLLEGAKAKHEKREAEQKAAAEAEQKAAEEKAAAEAEEKAKLQQQADEEKQRADNLARQLKAEREAREATEKGDADKLAALENATTDEKIQLWVDSFALPGCPVPDDERAKLIASKFEAFKTWADKVAKSKV